MALYRSEAPGPGEEDGDGIVRAGSIATGDGEYQYTLGEGGFWAGSTAGLFWLPDGSTDPRPVAETEGYFPSSVIPLDAERAAVVWLPEGGDYSDASSALPFVQAHTFTP